MLTARMFAAFAAAVKNDFHVRSKAFFTALEGGGDVLNVPQKNALDRLVRDLSGEPNANYATLDTWSKIKALYPVIGGTSTAHKWNLIDPRDLNAAHRMTFVGSPTHSANGISVNGVNQYGNTNLELTSLPTFDRGASIYIRSEGASGNPWIFGVYGGAGLFGLRITQPGAIGAVGANNLQNTTAGASRPAYSLSLTSASVAKVYNNGSAVLTLTPATTTLSGNVFVGCLNNGGSPAFFTPFEFSFFSLQNGLSAAEEAAFYNAIQSYQTALERQV